MGCFNVNLLLGDVLRIFAGDFKAGEMNGKKMSQEMLLGMAMLMVIPIVMLLLSLTLPNSVNRWINIFAAIGLFVFKLLAHVPFRL